MAYEPSWLGNQLMVLYLPLLAAGALARQSVFPFRRGGCRSRPSACRRC
jgi:hypothetical protein